MPKSKFVRVSLAFCLATLAFLLIPAEALAQPIGQYRPDTFLEQFRVYAQNSSGLLHDAAYAIFGTLATIELAVTSLAWGLSKKSFDSLLQTLVKKLLLWTLCLALITSYDTFFPPIVNGLQDLGAQAGGFDEALSWSDIFKNAVELQSESQAKAFQRGGDVGLFRIGVTLIVEVSVIITAGFVIFFALTAISIQLLFVQIEGVIASYMGYVVLGFAAFRGTAKLVDNYIQYLFYLGLKLFMIHVLLGIINVLALEILQFVVQTDAEGTAILARMFSATIGSLALAGVALRLPGLFAQKLTGGFSLGITEAHRYM